MKRPAKNRLAKIDSTIGGVGPKLQDRNGGFGEDGQFGVKALRKRRKMQQGMDCVARLSVRKLEAEHLTRREAMAGHGQRDPGWSEVAKSESGVEDEIGHAIAQFLAGSSICVGRASCPGMSLPSHASNSGAGRRPSVERR